ncbi:MAG: bacillithiol biosynthesis cysteine-adding enzyme BshC [Ignavibacteria bacterium]|jgi:bacillithiol biosynthesis cysteine-adding enzyme BshC
MFINFSDIPGNQNLYLDYLYEFENVEKFFERNFRDKAGYPDFFNKVSEYDRLDKSILVEIIKKQYEGKTVSSKTKENIELLKSANTFSIVTGQQLGLFGGPLYTFYKTITAIKLADELNNEYADYNFIPVFWLEGDDHDFNEVRSLNIINNENRLSNIGYLEKKDDDDKKESVGKLIFNEDIEQVIDDIKNNLRETEFTERIINELKSIYKKGESFSSAFFSLMFSIFDKYGLIIFNPQNEDVKKQLIHIFQKELENYSDHTDKIVERSAELEELYHAQVKVKPINLFMSDDNGRYLIEPSENNYKLKGRRKSFTKDEILELLYMFPEKFSGNVLLRPICQDYLLSTAFYIAGPGEISYFAQVLPLYEFFNIAQPIIYPRASVSISEKNVVSLLEKYNLKYGDLFTEESELNSKVIKSISDTNLDELFDNSNESIAKTMNELTGQLSNIDKTLPETANKTEQRIIQSLDQLKSKSVKAQERLHETVVRQIAKARLVFYPNDNLQERELNYIYFTNKYGKHILDDIFFSIEIDKFKHQVIEI